MVVVDSEGTPIPTPTDLPSDAPNILPVKNEEYGFKIIVLGLSLIGGLAGSTIISQIFAPDRVVEFLMVGNAISFIGGFLAGRKKQ